MDPEFSSTRDYIAALTGKGQYHFTTGEAARALNISSTAAQAAIRRLKAKGAVATPYRGFHVVVPPEYRRLGCLPPEQFVPDLMRYLGVPYYVGLLSAGRYHGAAHQQPQVLQVVVPKNRPGIRCGASRVAFVARHNTGEIPTVRFNTPRGEVAVATAEATAFDLVGYVEHCGGLDLVATVLVELAENLDARRLSAVAHFSPIPWAQRVGYLLDKIGAGELTDPLARYVREVVTETVPLSPRDETNRAPRDRRWKILVNVEVEPEL